MERYTNETRVCPHCHTDFTPNSGKQVYCCDGCRVNAHKAKNKQNTEELLVLVNDQTERLETLTNAPKTRREVIQEVNPDWHKLRQKVDAQHKVCSTTTGQLKHIQKENEELVDPHTGKTIGIVLGLITAAIPIAIGYDNRTRRSLGLTFLVLSVAGLLIGGLIGYYLGNTIGKRFINADTQRTDQLSRNHQQYDMLINQLLNENKVLASLETSLSETLKFTKETVVCVDETAVNLPYTR